MTRATSKPNRLDIMRHVDHTHGGDYWAWSLTSVDGDRLDGRIDDLAGTYYLDGRNPTAEAERVADQVCHQLDIVRDSVVLTMEGRQW